MAFSILFQTSGLPKASQSGLLCFVSSSKVTDFKINKLQTYQKQSMFVASA